MGRNPHYIAAFSGVTGEPTLPNAGGALGELRLQNKPYAIENSYNLRNETQLVSTWYRRLNFIYK